jgi:plastocyanin
MKSYLLSLLILASAAAVSAADLSGKVTLDGTPPPEKTVDLAGPFAVCSASHPGGLTTRHYIVGADKGLANVFVYVKTGAPKSAPAGEGPVLDQKGCLYEPYVLGVQAGQEFTIKNSDSFMHNIHALPQANDGFNFAQPLANMKTKKKFDKPEVLVKFQCDVHPWMFAYVGVVDNPYFAVTDKDGKFTIKNLPPGTYTIEAVHPKAGRKSQEIKVTDSAKPLDFTLSVPSAK